MATPPPSGWGAEREFFDARAEKAAFFDLERVALRYEAAKARPLYPLEVAYAWMGDLRGKRVLDVGCGQGENSLLFARWGAQVTGVDLSSGAIALARARAVAAGLDKRTSFVALPFEELSSQDGAFDLIWSGAFLHHVVDRLEEVSAQLRGLLHPRGVVLMYEPVRLSPFIKRIRKWIPPAPVGTPDERPLEPVDLAKIEREFVVTARRLWGPLSRLTIRSVMSGPYETASASRRWLSDFSHRIDQRLTNSAILANTGMEMVATLEPRYEPLTS